MKLISDSGGPVRVLALGGEIDLHFARVFRTLLEEKGDEKIEALVLDLSEVAFIDSSGIAAIIEHLRDAGRQGDVFCIGGMTPAVKEIFALIHLEKAMPIYQTREAALAAIARGQLAEPNEPLFTQAD
jgi:anti-anti-sigma factor